MHPRLACTVSALIPAASEASSQQGATHTHKHTETLASDLQAVVNRGSFHYSYDKTLKSLALNRTLLTSSRIEVIRRDECRWRNFNARINVSV